MPSMTIFSLASSTICLHYLFPSSFRFIIGAEVRPRELFFFLFLPSFSFLSQDSDRLGKLLGLRNFVQFRETILRLWYGYWENMIDGNVSLSVLLFIFLGKTAWHRDRCTYLHTRVRAIWSVMVRMILPQTSIQDRTLASPTRCRIDVTFNAFSFSMFWGSSDFPCHFRVACDVTDSLWYLV